MLRLNISRRQALIGLGAVPFCVNAGAAPKKSRVEIAADRAATFLLGMQEANGTFNDPKARRSAQQSYAMTALSVLALASIGHQPADLGKVGSSLNRALDFILRKDPRRGEYEYFGSDGSRMYGHGITTLCHTEKMAMGKSKTQEARLRRESKNANN